MTSEEVTDGNKESNDKEKGEENEPKRSFRAEYARKTHNSIEKKRKDKIAIWINKISELLPKDPKKESKNAILEKAFHYMVHLKETNDKLIYGNADQITGEELRSARKRIKKLEDTNAVYYKLLKMSGITPTNIPLDLMNPNPLLTAKSKQESPNNEKIPPYLDNSVDGDQSDAASDTTEVIKGEDTGKVNHLPNNVNTNLQTGSGNCRLLNTNNSTNAKNHLLVVNQNQDHNTSRISLSNGSQLQIRPSPNVQILGNGALAIDSSGFNQGPIILGSTLLSPPQPTTLVMHNGQLLSLVNQPQPAFVYTPGSGFVLTSANPVNSSSINIPTQPKPAAEQPEKIKRKCRLSTINSVGQEKISTEVRETIRPKKTRNCQKSNVKQVQVNGNSGAVEDDHVNAEQQSQQQQDQSQQTIQLTPNKKRGRPFKINQKAKVTTDKLTLSEVDAQNSEMITNENGKRPRLTTVIERVSDSPIKRCLRNQNKANKGSTTKDLNDELGETDLETENYSFRQNGEATCVQDQLPLLLGSLSEDHEMSTESNHSVSNSSLPTFLSLSPSDHLTDFLSKASDHGNGTTRSPRYSSPMNRINANTSNSQTPSVVMSNQGNNIITESSNCHENESYQHHHHHHHHHQQHHSNEQLETNSYPSNTSNNTGQGRLYSADSQEDRRRSEPSDKTTTSQSVVRKSQEARDSTSSSATAQQTSTGNTTLDSPPSSSTNNNNPTTANQLLPYSAESLLRQQPQQSSNTNNMPASVPINSIYHVQSNVTVDPNIEFSSRGNSTSSNATNNNPSARPTISYSAERLIHTPPGENNHVSSSNRQKSQESGKVTSIAENNNNTTSNNQTSNIYNEQYSIIRTARGSSDLDSDLSQLQSAHHHQHHQQQQQHASNMYRSSPQAHDQRANQEQHHSSRTGNTNLNVNNQSNQTQQQIMHQQRNAYSENHHHHQQQPPPPPPPPPTQQTSQQSRGQSHQSTQCNSSSQGQINLKTTSTSASNSSPTASTNNGSGNSATNNGRELFNHHYPYVTSEGSTNERNANLMNFTNTGNGQNEGFIDNASASSGAQNNFLSPFPPNGNCQPPFIPPNNRRSTNSSTSVLTPFNFSDSSFSDPYNRQAHGVSGNSSNSAVNFSDSNRRLGNTGHFVDHTASSTSSNNPSNNYFMAHNHHVSSSSLSNSNNPPIFSTSSSFPSLISSSTNSNYDNNGYNLTCPSRSSTSSINTTTNISPSSNTLSNSNLHHHHHSHHHSTFYSDSGVSSIQSMHNARRPSESSSFSASSNNNKSNANTTNNGAIKATNSTPSTSSANSKQSAKSTGGSSSKSTKKASSTTATVSKSRPPENPRSTTTNVSNPSLVTSYSSTFAPPPPPPPSASAVPIHNGNRSIVTSTSSSSTLLNISSSTERSTVDTSESLFRPQSQSNTSANIQTTSSSSRSTGPSTHGLAPPVGHSSSFLPNFQYPLGNFLAEMGSIQSINPNDNFTMPGLSAIKFTNHPANVLPHHPSSNTPFTHSSTLQGSVPMDNSSGSMGDNSSHQNIYAHHSRIATPHHNHLPIYQLIGTSPRTLK